MHGRRLTPIVGWYDAAADWTSARRGSDPLLHTMPRHPRDQRRTRRRPAAHGYDRPGSAQTRVARRADKRSRDGNRYLEQVFHTAAIRAAQYQPEIRQEYRRLARRKGKIAASAHREGTRRCGEHNSPLAQNLVSGVKRPGNWWQDVPMRTVRLCQRPVRAPKPPSPLHTMLRPGPAGQDQRHRDNR